MSTTEKMVLALADKCPPRFAEPLRKCAPAVAAIERGIDAAAPHIVKAYKVASAFVKSLPADLCWSIWGLLLCFFGGNFPLVIAAFEAARQCGWESFESEFRYLCGEVHNLKLKNEEDNKKDEDGDGTADVLQMGPSALLTRKMQLYLTQTKDPDKISHCVGQLTSACAGVVATLKLQFARTVSLGVSIGNTMRPLANKYFLPILKKAVPEQYHKWLPSAIGFVCKSIAVTIAWTIQKIISAVQSATKGGLLFSRHGIKYAVDKKWMNNLDLDNTYIDEAIGGLTACLGIWWQLRSFFGLPFPLWLVFMPITMCESALEWVVTE